MLAGTKKQPLKKTGLKSSTSLKANIAKKPKQRVPLEKKTAQQLVKVADEAYSKYIRLRDSAGDGENRTGTCVTCSRPLQVLVEGRFYRGQNGHFVSRGFMITRYDDMNCHLQCSHCNAWRDKRDMTSAYAKAVDKLYGKGCADELEELTKQDGSKRIPPKEELLDIIYTCRAYIKRTLGE